MQLEIVTEKSNGFYGLIWGTRAFILAEKRLGITLTDIILSVDDQDVILTLAYCALQNWYEVKDETNVLPFSYAEFQHWLDEQPESVGIAIVSSYMESSYQGRTMSDRYDAIRDIMEAGENNQPSKPVKKKKSPSVK